jgi:hypothetical protein
MKTHRFLSLGTICFVPLVLLGFGGKEDIGVFSESRVVRSSHFVLHFEDSLAPAGVLNTLEGLHAKLLLDLGAFSPWAYQESIHVYLYRDGTSYAAHTGMNPWTVAHINILEKKVYGHSSSDFQRVLSHELGHLFFTQFFLTKSTTPPLWLNEGVATMMEWQYGLESDQKAMDRALLASGTIPFSQFLTFNYFHAGASEGAGVGLWYNQAQSVTRYLMRGFSQAQFLTFCEGLRAGRTMDESLRAAYGLALPSVDALEQQWREHLH